MQIHLQQPARAKNTLTYLIEKFTETLADHLVLKKKLNGHLSFLFKVHLCDTSLLSTLQSTYSNFHKELSHD